MEEFPLRTQVWLLREEADGSMSYTPGTITENDGRNYRYTVRLGHEPYQRSQHGGGYLCDRSMFVTELPVITEAEKINQSMFGAAL